MRYKIPKGNIPWNKGLTKDNDERIRKIFESRKNYQITDETREKLRQSHLGHKDSQETKEKKRFAHLNKKNKPMSEEGRKNIGISHVGIKQSSESISKRVLKLIGQKGTAETRKKISDGLKGKKLSKEHKLKLSLVRLGKPRLGNPLNWKLSRETIEKVRQGNLGKISHRKGKTFEEEYGLERALEIKKKMSLADKGKHNSSSTEFKKGIIPWCSGTKGIVKAWNKGLNSSENHKKNMSLSRKKYLLDNPQEKIRLIEIGKKAISPKKDTSIEVKVQNMLKTLGIEFYTHYLFQGLDHNYKCDIMIPVQEGISKKTIIECFGDYWHKYPLAREIDTIRCEELKNAGWRVLVFWEREIKLMHTNNLYEKLIV